MTGAGGGEGSRSVDQWVSESVGENLEVQSLVIGHWKTVKDLFRIWVIFSIK